MESESRESVKRMACENARHDAKWSAPESARRRPGAGSARVSGVRRRDRTCVVFGVRSHTDTHSHSLTHIQTMSCGVRLFAVGEGCESVSVTCVSAVRSLCARAHSLCVVCERVS